MMKLGLVNNDMSSIDCIACNVSSSPNMLAYVAQ
uniref:Uncharacterized protein n=1 Tax=Parascaris equorum TaxID=6256 RepID=A0A914RFL2_PAREQ